MSDASHNQETERAVASAWLEDFQHRVYQGLNIEPRISDDFDEAAYRKFIAESHISKAEESFGRDQSALIEMMVNARREALKAVPTRYEEPSLYAMISDFGKDIEKALIARGRSLPVQPLFGTVPTGRVNGFAMAIPNSNYRAILLEDGLFGFANLMCKAVAMVFPGRETEGRDGISFSTDWDDVSETLNTNPEIGARFFDALAAYLVAGHPHAAKPYLASRSVTFLSSVLRDSMETFVVAHEFGHVVAGHLGPAVSRKMMIADVDVDTISTDWIQEFEADAIGLEAMLAVRIQHGYDLSLSFWGADAFFGCIDVVEKALSILLFGEEKPWQADTHPPTTMRRDMMRLILSRSLEGKNEEAAEAAIALAGIVEKVIDHLWGLSRPAFLRMHHAGIRPTAGWTGADAS